MPIGGPLLSTEQDLVLWFGRGRLDKWRRGWKDDARRSFGGKAYALKRNVIEYLTSHPHNLIKIEDISYEFNKTESYISRIMKELVCKKLVKYYFKNGNRRVKYFMLLRRG